MSAAAKKTDLPAELPPLLIPDDGRPPASFSDGELADLYFGYKSRIDLFAPTKDRGESLAKEIRLRFDKSPADKEFLIIGSRAEVQIGMKNKERSLSSIYKLYKLSKLKIQDFLAKCKISLTEAEAIPGSQALIEEARTGWRPLKPVLRVDTQA